MLRDAAWMMAWTEELPLEQGYQESLKEGDLNRCPSGPAKADQCHPTVHILFLRVMSTKDSYTHVMLNKKLPLYPVLIITMVIPLVTQCRWKILTRKGEPRKKKLIDG
jgi:hypothetical protein